MDAFVKYALITVIAVSVISDCMLLPFYPQFFNAVYSVTDPLQVSLYLAATSVVVMLAFPLWARVVETVPVIRLLVYTQLAAGLLSIQCYLAETLPGFWSASLLMLLFKGSYLLIYPHIMRFEQKQRHSGTIGLLSVIAHLSAILGAGIGGFVLQLLAPKQIFLLMAVGDFMQMLVCCCLLGGKAAALPEHDSEQEEPVTNTANTVQVNRLGIVMLLFYFSIWLMRPYFSSYWEKVSGNGSEIVSGLVFAIPGVMALLALCLKQSGKQALLTSLLLGVTGVLLQAGDNEIAMLFGRCLYGWALFHATVGLDSLLFALSTPASYAGDFSKIYFLQSLGALLALFAVGRIVAVYDVQTPLIAAAAGLLVTTLIYVQFFKAHDKPFFTVIKSTTHTD